MAKHKYFDEDDKLWSGPKTPTVFNPNISLGHSLLWCMNNNPKKIIQISHDTNIQISNETMKSYTIRAAMYLQSQGCEQGDVIGIIAKNGHFVAPIVYASFCIGCPVSYLDPAFSRSEILHMISITKPKLMFCDAALVELVRECLEELENEATVYSFGDEVENATPVEHIFEETPDEKEFSIPEIDGMTATAAIVCTSGSTGLSKGVCLSHASLLQQTCRIMVCQDDIMTSFSTPYWISGMITVILCPLRGLCRVITTESFTPDLLLNIIEEHRVTCMLSATHQLVLTVKSENFQQADISSMRLLMCAGSKLSPITAMEISKKLPNGVVAEIYGMSELAGGISVNIISSETDTSVGRLTPNNQAKIVDDDGNRLGENECGEVCLKGMYKFLGYYNNDEATADAIDDEGFLKTGDIGYFDSDGKLYLVDRKKDMMKYCASQISPTELEQFLIQSPSIKAVCVVGIPDALAGELPAAVIMLNENEPPITEDDVQQMIADSFSDHKRLRGGVYFMDTIPLTASGKIIRRVVKNMAIELYENEHSEPDS